MDISVMWSENVHKDHAETDEAPDTLVCQYARSCNICRIQVKYKWSWLGSKQPLDAYNGLNNP